MVAVNCCYNFANAMHLFWGSLSVVCVATMIERTRRKVLWIDPLVCI